MNTKQNKLIKYLFVVCILLCCAITLQSCKHTNKNHALTEQDLNKKQDMQLIKNMSLPTLGINDTINNIRGKIVFANFSVKDDDNPDISAINHFVENSIHNFCKQVKAINNADRQDTNYFYLYIKGVYKYKDIISVLFQTKQHLTGSNLNTEKYFSFNYDENDSKRLKFFDVFNVNKKNLQNFNKIFNCSFTLNELTDIDFNFENQMLWLFDPEKPNQRIGIGVNKIKKYLIDD